MRAIVFDRVGAPLDVLAVRDVAIPNIGEHEVLVELAAASINPGDFLFIQSLYPEPKKPRFPAQIAGTGGGAGYVVKGGKGTSIHPGTLVAFSYYNAWAEYAVVPEEWLMPLPSEYPVETAAQFANIISAYDMLIESGARPGQWLALTAGNSSVATMVLQLARAKDINVISIVRSAQPDLDLRAWGAAEVIELSAGTGERGIGERIAEITRGKGLHGVIDCVGGPLAGELIRSLAMGGQAVLYGGFSPERFALHSFDLLLKASTVKSYVYRYFFDPASKEDAPLLREIAALSGSAEFKTRIAARHPLDDFRNAVEQSLLYGEKGKHLFRMGAVRPER